MPARAPSAELFFSQWQPLILTFVRTVSQVFQPGQQVTSWFRTPSGNQAAGGDPESQHLLAIAADVVGPRLAASQMLAKRLHLFTLMERDHLHIQMFAPGALSRMGVRFPRAEVRTAIATTPSGERESQFA